ncbi:hypothetical protein M3212_08035 [Alkalihalobacillus oceani]|uniref:hypothetical protein n=1 Tax=Halalkalibacter oceani TaxID=1653776 RepID=UPI00203EE1BE|nr:hypothetical protein [Halalkalibacter oceani]MCM3760736.1 hypothetical protein [Halalkalibacter oceani]
MKKRVWLFALFLVTMIGGAYGFLQLNPPIETGTLAASGDTTSVVVGIANNGFRDVEIVEVLVNHEEKPLKTGLQVSNASHGFIITDDFTGEDADEYRFTDVNETAIKRAASLSSAIDEIYGVSVIHHEEVKTVHIRYSYFGMIFTDTVDFAAF